MCCGDGFNAYHFYSIKAKHIVSVDFDKTAISHAGKNHNAGNILFQLSDIRNGFPEGKFDNIIWDAAIEHFNKEEINEILLNIRQHLKSNGILSGYTIKENNDTGKSLEQHEYEFKSKEDLLPFFVPYFKNVKIFETVYPSRHNLYFFASDHVLPFDDKWPAQITANTSETGTCNEKKQTHKNL